MKTLQQFLGRSMRHWQAIGLVIVIALAVIPVPQVDPSDWALNTDHLSDGFAIYEHPNYVYPPWALIFFWVYRWMSPIGARICAVLVVAWLAYSQDWTIRRFLAIIINPLFVFSMLFSNIDLLIYTFAIILWFTSDTWRATGFWRGLALAILLLKPQGSLFVIPYLLWQERAAWRQVIFTLMITAIFTVPISLMGSPPLILQWLDNIRNPSSQNAAMWAANNISMSSQLGWVITPVLLILSFAGIFFAMRQAGKPWTVHHSFASLLLGSMLLSPYTSTQSVIAALAFVPSWIATLSHYTLTFVASTWGVYTPYASLWMLLFGLIALWFMPQEDTTEKAHP